MALHTASALLLARRGMSDEEKATEAPRKKRRSKLLLFAPIVLLLAGVPAGAYVWMQHRSANGNGAVAKPDHSGVLPLDPFTVNLADKDSPRFLRITMSLVVDDRDQVEDLRKDALKQARLRSELLELLTQQTADTLVSPDGKNKLKQAIAQRAAGILQPLKVTDVLLADFVVQF
jgi:flagellar protein FliL